MARLAAGGNVLDTISWPGSLHFLHLSHFLSLCLSLSLSLSPFLCPALCLLAVKFELLIAVAGRVLSLISLFLASFAKYYVYAYAALAAAACKFPKFVGLFLRRK